MKWPIKEEMLSSEEGQGKQCDEKLRHVLSFLITGIESVYDFHGQSAVFHTHDVVYEEYAGTETKHGHVHVQLTGRQEDWKERKG